MTSTIDPSEGRNHEKVYLMRIKQIKPSEEPPSEDLFYIYIYDYMTHDKLIPTNNLPGIFYDQDACKQRESPFIRRQPNLCLKRKHLQLVHAQQNSLH